MSWTIHHLGVALAQNKSTNVKLSIISRTEDKTFSFLFAEYERVVVSYTALNENEFGADVKCEITPAHTKHFVMVVRELEANVRVY